MSNDACDRVREAICCLIPSICGNLRIRISRPVYAVDCPRNVFVSVTDIESARTGTPVMAGMAFDVVEVDGMDNRRLLELVAERLRVAITRMEAVKWGEQVTYSPD